MSILTPSEEGIARSGCFDGPAAPSRCDHAWLCRPAFCRLRPDGCGFLGISLEASSTDADTDADPHGAAEPHSGPNSPALPATQPAAHRAAYNAAAHEPARAAAHRSARCHAGPGFC